MLLLQVLGDALDQAKPLTSDVMRQALVLAGVAFVLGLLVGKPVIDFLIRNKIGKQIRIDGPQTHLVKMGTPTMGGIAIIGVIGVLILLFLAINQFKFLSLLLPLGILASCGTLGAIDDLLSTVGRAQGGLSARFKMGWLIIISLIAGFILYNYLGLHSAYIPFSGSSRGIDIGIWYIPIAAFIIVGTANAVNLTDGLDSLAGGTLAVAFAAYGIIAYLQGQAPVVPLCFISTGSLLAFLWFNSHPALVFMGDAGSLTMGALLAVAALMTGQWLLLPVIGIIFVAVAMSDILQVLYFKITGGKRLFKMAPLQHHFELLGWSETQVMMRFWLVGMLGAMMGVALALALAGVISDW